MRQLERDLWQSTLHQSGILNTHAYFLERPEGNVLFYNIGHDQDLETIAKLGGIRYQLLSHRDESGPSLERIRSRFGSKLGCSSVEAPVVGSDAPLDVIFEEGHHSLEDIEIIHTPGHTDGSICFFYRSPTGKSYLFTGDTVFQWNGRWATLVLRNAGGSTEALAESLLRAARPRTRCRLVERLCRRRVVRRGHARGVAPSHRPGVPATEQARLTGHADRAGWRAGSARYGDHTATAVVRRFRWRR